MAAKKNPAAVNTPSNNSVANKIKQENLKKSQGLTDKKIAEATGKIPEYPKWYGGAAATKYAPVPAWDSVSGFYKTYPSSQKPIKNDDLPATTTTTSDISSCNYDSWDNDNDWYDPAAAGKAIGVYKNATYPSQPKPYPAMVSSTSLADYLQHLQKTQAEAIAQQEALKKELEKEAQVEEEVIFDEVVDEVAANYRSAYLRSSKAYEELHVLLAADQPWIAASSAEPGEIYGILQQVVEDQKHLEADLAMVNLVDRTVSPKPGLKSEKLIDFETLASLLEKTWRDAEKAPNKRPRGIEAKFALCKALGMHAGLNRPPANDRRLVLFVQNAHFSLKTDEKNEINPYNVTVIQLWSQRLGEMGVNIVCHFHPTESIDKTITHYFARVSYDPPNLEGRRAVVQCFAKANLEEGEASAELLETLAGSVSGLQPTQIEQALSRCLAMKGKIDIPQVLALKTEILNDSTALRVLQPEFGFEKVGGLEGIRDFVLPMLTRQSKSGKRRPKGVVLLGIGGTGKSMFCKALGKATGRTTLVLDVGALFGKYVGDTESRLRHALACVEASSPCILMLDELEKAIGGSGEQHEVSQRARGTLMTWLNDRPNGSDVFVVATINDITLLPPEFCRSERFDAVFFVDLPNVDQKKAIWKIWMDHYQLEVQETPDDAGWTGAEISSCCGLADLLGVSLLEASNYVIPLSKSQAEAVVRQQAWAEGRCVDAATGKLYEANHEDKGSSYDLVPEPEETEAAPKRRIQRATSPPRRRD